MTLSVTNLRAKLAAYRTPSCESCVPFFPSVSESLMAAIICIISAHYVDSWHGVFVITQIVTFNGGKVLSASLRI